MSATTSSSSSSTSNSVNIKHPDRFYVDGQWIQPSTGKTINVLNSGTEEIFLKVAEAQEADVNRAVAAARKAFDKTNWSLFSQKERAVYLRKIGRRTAARTDRLTN